MALAEIQKSIKPNVLVKIIGTKHACHAWKILKNCYEKSGRYARVLLLEKLMNLKYDEEDDMNDHYTEKHAIFKLQGN